MPAQWVMMSCLQWATGENMCHLPRRPAARAAGVAEAWVAPDAYLQLVALVALVLGVCEYSGARQRRRQRGGAEAAREGEKKEDGAAASVGLEGGRPLVAYPPLPRPASRSFISGSRELL